jgi:hypothetical protein
MKNKIYTPTIIFLLVLKFYNFSFAQIPKIKFYKYQSTVPTRVPTTSQSTSCNELIYSVEHKLRKVASVSHLSLLDSSWLLSVDGYDYDGDVIVIATIKSESSVLGKKYIFCNVPKDNWNYFYNPISTTSMSYGERFHKSIVDYKCDCN